MPSLVILHLFILVLLVYSFWRLPLSAFCPLFWSFNAHISGHGSTCFEHNQCQIFLTLSEIPLGFGKSFSLNDFCQRSCFEYVQVNDSEEHSALGYLNFIQSIINEECKLDMLYYVIYG